MIPESEVKYIIDAIKKVYCFEYNAPEQSFYEELVRTRFEQKKKLDANKKTKRSIPEYALMLDLDNSMNGSLNFYAEKVTIDLSKFEKYKLSFGDGTRGYTTFVPTNLLRDNLDKEANKVEEYIFGNIKSSVLKLKAQNYKSYDPIMEPSVTDLIAAFEKANRLNLINNTGIDFGSSKKLNFRVYFFSDKSNISFLKRGALHDNSANGKQNQDRLIRHAAKSFIRNDFKLMSEVNENKSEHENVNDVNLTASQSLASFTGQKTYNHRYAQSNIFYRLDRERISTLSKQKAPIHQIVSEKEDYRKINLLLHLVALNYKRGGKLRELKGTKSLKYFAGTYNKEKKRRNCFILANKDYKDTSLVQMDSIISPYSRLSKIASFSYDRGDAESQEYTYINFDALNQGTSQVLDFGKSTKVISRSIELSSLVKKHADELGLKEDQIKFTFDLSKGFKNLGGKHEDFRFSLARWLVTGETKDLKNKFKIEKKTFSTITIKSDAYKDAKGSYSNHYNLQTKRYILALMVIGEILKMESQKDQHIEELAQFIVKAKSIFIVSTKGTGRGYNHEVEKAFTAGSSYAKVRHAVSKHRDRIVANAKKNEAVNLNSLLLEGNPFLASRASGNITPEDSLILFAKIGRIEKENKERRIAEKEKEKEKEKENTSTETETETKTETETETQSLN